MTDDILIHHGIKGQRWGEKNGPPYPLSGSDYTPDQIKKNRKLYLNKMSKENRKNNDFVIKKGHSMQTLSVDKNRIEKSDMYYAGASSIDKLRYNGFFNSALAEDIVDPVTGEKIGDGSFYKWNIETVAKHDIKVASEKSQQDAFVKLYSESKDFSNYINDPNRFEKNLDFNHLRTKQYRKAIESLHSIQQSNSRSESDLRNILKLYNYSLPSDNDDSVAQRAKFFNQLKKSGYGSAYDTNDGIYGRMNANKPVIVFDMESVVIGNKKRDGGTRVARDRYLTGRTYHLNYLLKNTSI